MSSPAPEITIKQGEIETPVGDAPILPLLLLGFGAYLMWFGVKYWRGTGAAAWPSYPIKSVLQGKGLPPNTPAPPPTAEVSSYEATIAQEAAGASGTGSAGNPLGGGKPGPAGGTPGQNQNIAKLLAARFGWSPAQSPANWSALVTLWNSESGWSNTIWNVSASCGNNAYAFGIPQACGHGIQKNIPGHGSWCPFPAGNPGNPPECGGSNNASAQILWGLNYIKQNYGSPVNVPLGGY